MRLDFDLSAAPTSGLPKSAGKSRFEINFRRLLRVCEEQTARFLKASAIRDECYSEEAEKDCSTSKEDEVFSAWRLDKVRILIITNFLCDVRF
jgi:hypothetical protein